MTAHRRYAIYYAPELDDPLAAFGASWLGWSLETGVPVERPSLSGLPRPIEGLTTSPSRYGFHGTLKPPFRPTADLATIADAAEGIAATIAPFPAPPFALATLGGFLALIPAKPSPHLAALAEAMVRGLDIFRAPPTEAELSKRRAATLTDWQEEMLRQWGYPYVGPEFRFHLTLTDKLTMEEAEAAKTALAPVVAPLLDPSPPRIIRSVALCGEIDGGADGDPHDGCFEIIRRIPLLG